MIEPELRTRLYEKGRGGLPLVIAPTRRGDALARQLAPLDEDPAWLRRALREHGAVLLRGFAVEGPEDFERVARAIEPRLANDYLGTSPRDAVTEYVFNASELPDYYPIPQHIEMSFVAKPPRTLFFCCLVPPEGAGGETPLVDFRLDPRVRARFERLGVRNVRNYDGPATPKSRDLWKLKRWDEMFRTADKREVERIAEENGFEVRWKAHDRLALINTQTATRRHPETGEEVWFNHVQVFHPHAAGGEYLRIARRQAPRLEYLGLAAFAHAMVAIKRRFVADDDLPMFCSYGDGSPITNSDLSAVRRAIWNNLVFPRWQRGDVVAIDNQAVAHGRMPYRGPRRVVVAWA